MEIKNEKQRDGLRTALADQPCPIVVQQANLDGWLVIFAGVGTEDERTIRVTPDGRFSRQ